MRKLLPLLAGVALFAGAAQAGEPVLLSEAQMDGLTAGTVPTSSYFQYDKVVIDFTSNNNFGTYVNSPYTLTNSASAGAKGDAINNTYYPTYSFTKADTLAVTEYLGGSFSASTSAAVINAPYDLYASQ